MDWLNTPRKCEQIAVKPPQQESKKIIPPGSPCEIRKSGDDDWRPFTTRRTIDCDTLRCGLDGYFTGSEGEYEIRVHRKNSVVAAFEHEHAKTPSPPRKKPPVKRMVGRFQVLCWA